MIVSDLALWLVLCVNKVKPTLVLSCSFCGGSQENGPMLQTSGLNGEFHEPAGLKLQGGDKAVKVWLWTQLRLHSLTKCLKECQLYILELPPLINLVRTRH